MEYDEEEMLEKVFVVGRKLKAEVEIVNVSSDKQLTLIYNGKLIKGMKKAFPYEDLKTKSISSNDIEEAILKLS
ncbi:MAG: hypothetical protein ACI97P_001866 [Arcticibacterium sp.]